MPTRGRRKRGARRADPRGPAAALRRHFRRGCDEGSASMLTYIVGAALFLLSSTFLVSFVVQPPGATTSGLDHLDLKSRASHGLQVILETPGYPRGWGSSASGIDSVGRLGLLEEGTSIRVNVSKFEALAKGKYLTSSSANGHVDYAEAKRALGLDGYDFHLRAHPVFDPSKEGTFGITGMSSFRIGYVGDFNGATWSEAAKSEAYVLQELDVAFGNATRSSSATGDVFEDDKHKLKEHLLPLIGTSVGQTVISEGSGTKHGFHRVHPDVYKSLVPGAGSPSRALALSTADGGTLGYTRNREIRATLGAINMSDHGAANVTWKEWVDTDRTNLSFDAGDYGYIEVSADGGATWRSLVGTVSLVDGGIVKRSEDTATNPQPPGWRSRSATLSNDTCPGCGFNPNLLLAFHWVGDNDASIGYGWVIDDVVVTGGSPVAPQVLVRKTFETPEYDMLVIGSNVDHQAFTPNEIKEALRDYVNLYNGRLVVTGGQVNTQWLQPLFQVGVRGASPGVATPDTTHPLLTVPNQLAWRDYANNNVAWDFSANGQKDLFNMVVGTAAGGHVLSASVAGAFGSANAEGNVILTTYLPSSMKNNESFRFLANAITYGRYHHLYLEVGPPVPTDVPVGSAMRTAVMEKTRTGSGEMVEMTFVLYVWQGSTTAQTLAGATLTPLAPRSVTAQAGHGRVWVNWTWPDVNGTASVTHYEVFRGTSPSSVSTLVHTTANNATFSYLDTGLANGTSYYYNVTAVSGAGRGLASGVASATPSGLAHAPPWDALTGGAVPGPGEIELRWSMPAYTNGSAITGYRIWNQTGTGAWTILGDVGNTTGYVHSGLGGGQTHSYKVQALNAAGYGLNSTPVTQTTLAVAVLASAPGNFAVSNASVNNLTLTWTTPASLGTGSLQGYRVYVSNDSGATYTQLAYLNSAANVSFVHVGVGAGVTRHYMVQAVTSVGDGLNSTAASNRTMNVPGAPTGLSLVPGVGGTMSLSWTPPATDAAVQSYRVYRSTSPSTGFVLVKNPAVNAEVDTGLLASTTYYYRVTAVSAAGEGDYVAGAETTGIV